jgi:hypothetical protein
MPALKPFGRTIPVTLEADFTLRPGGIEIRFALDAHTPVANALKDGAWTAETAARTDGLWNTTCFEAFWAEPGRDTYWELNLAASGAWNLYRFDSLRTPQPPRTSDDYALKSLRTTPTSLICELTSALRPAALDIALTAVIATPDRTFYYALHHPRPQPDFHDRAGFVLRRTV